MLAVSRNRTENRLDPRSSVRCRNSPISRQWSARFASVCFGPVADEPLDDAQGRKDDAYRGKKENRTAEVKRTS